MSFLDNVGANCIQASNRSAQIVNSVVPILNEFSACVYVFLFNKIALIVHCNSSLRCKKYILVSFYQNIIHTLIPFLCTKHFMFPHCKFNNKMHRFYKYCPSFLNTFSPFKYTYAFAFAIMSTHSSLSCISLNFIHVRFYVYSNGIVHKFDDFF